MNSIVKEFKSIESNMIGVDKSMLHLLNIVKIFMEYQYICFSVEVIIFCRTSDNCKIFK